MKELSVKVVSNEEIVPGIFEIFLELPEPIEFRCGQFLNLSVGDGAHLLRRPFAIFSYDKETRRAGVCYQVKGEGTQLLSRKEEGDVLQCVVPLGNGFVIPKEAKRVALVGGGVGIFPLLSVLNEYHDSDIHFRSYMGFRSAEYVNSFGMYDHRSDALFVATDDGSFGAKGTAVSEFFKDLEDARPDVILSCGPTPMLRALKAGLAERGLNIPCFVSLEERMGCGIGACLVCVCKKTDGKGNARVCKDGPVFEIGEVEL